MSQVESPPDTGADTQASAGEIPAAQRPVSPWVGTLLTIFAIAWLFVVNGGFGPRAYGIATSVLATAAIYAIAALGLNVHFGFTGLLNIGHVAFMAVGAYTTVLLIPHELGRAGTGSDGVSGD